MEATLTRQEAATSLISLRNRMAYYVARMAVVPSAHETRAACGDRRPDHGMWLCRAERPDCCAQRAVVRIMSDRAPEKRIPTDLSTAPSW